MKPVRTIIFDLGGVYFTEGVRRFVAKMEELHGVSEAKVRAIVDGPIGKQYRTADITSERFWEQAKAHWGLTIDTTELAQLWLDGYQPIEGTVRLIDRLNKAGYELLFLSDNAPDRVDYLESRYKFLDKFKAGMFSHITKERKPHTKMYEGALALASHPAAECVYIDDKPGMLVPAKELGMHALLFTTPEQLENDLRELGVRY